MDLQRLFLLMVRKRRGDRYMPFDPNELRRRRLIGPKTQFLGDIEGGVPNSQIPKRAPSTPGPEGIPDPNMSAANRYRQYLESRPEEADYRPSILRRILAGAAGFGTGYTEGGGAGAEMAGSIVHAPYASAYQEWVSRGAGLDKMTELEEADAMQRYRDTMAGAAERRASAFETSAGATVTRAGAAEVTAGKIPTQEQALERIRARPAGQPRRTFEEEERLTEMRERIKSEYREADEPDYLSPSDKYRADFNAIQTLYRSHPEYRDFFDVDRDTGQAFVKVPDEDDLRDNPELANAFNEFLLDLEQATRGGIEETREPGGLGGRYEIE